MALKAASTDLLFLLDVDNSVPEDVLWLNEGAFWREPEIAYLQFMKFVCNGHSSLVAWTAAITLGCANNSDLALSSYGDWSFSGTCLPMEASRSIENRASRSGLQAM